jgi:hypothetical protein
MNYTCEQSPSINIRNLEWMIEREEKDQLPIYTADCETDPFARGNVPVPFVFGFYDGLKFWDFWTDSTSNCLEKFRNFLEDGEVEPGIIYFHNGGRFDFFYILDFFAGKTMIIGSRIVRAFMPLDSKRSTRFNRFEFRDSFAIMPFALGEYQKDHIEIDWLRKENRKKYHDAIRYYLFGDCRYLWELCVQFQREFGDYTTIASASFSELGKFHKYQQLPLRQDAEIRDKFYFGGRVQCFEKGFIEQDVTIYDVNSMYPYVMDTYYHPTSWISIEGSKILGWKDDGTFNSQKTKTFFLTVEGSNQGAFPVRKKDGSVDFTVESGIFNVSIHEWNEAMRLGIFQPTRILATYSFSDYTRFHLFVDHFYKKREEAKKSGDKMHSMFYKYILNSAYGKFGLNPENYFNYEITSDSTQPKGEGWELDKIIYAGKNYLWKQPSKLFWNVKNIATAASITGAARSVLLSAIVTSNNVLYCDTDSIICGTFGSGTIDDKRLGAWKPEGHGQAVSIAGKKMYAVFDHIPQSDDVFVETKIDDKTRWISERGECIKHANKGVMLLPHDILRVSLGESLFSERDAPTFKMDGSATFISRTVRMT